MPRKDRYERAAADGRCPHCLSREPAPGRVLCRVCAVKKRKAASKPGVIYAIFQEDGGYIKIGYTSRDPYRRLAELQSGNPHKLRLIGVRSGTMADEQAILDAFAEVRIPNLEWFKAEDIKSFVAKEFLDPDEFENPVYAAGLV